MTDEANKNDSEPADKISSSSNQTSENSKDVAVVEEKANETRKLTDLADLGLVTGSTGESDKPVESKAEVVEVASEEVEETKESTEIRTLSDLSEISPPENATIYVQRIDTLGRAYATGKRKDAVARVWLKPGTGRIIVNERDIEVFFARPVLRMLINQPFEVANRNGQFDVMCTVKGGGLSGQAGAVRHGISKALLAYEPTLRSTLKSGGFLRRDARVVERKKYGRAKARRSFQFSKR